MSKYMVSYKKKQLEQATVPNIVFSSLEEALKYSERHIQIYSGDTVIVMKVEKVVRSKPVVEDAWAL